MPIEKEDIRIDKNGEEITKNISYILQFDDGARFMAGFLSILVNNLSEEIHRIKYGMMIKNVKLTELNISIATVFLDKQTSKMI